MARLEYSKERKRNPINNSRENIRDKRSFEDFHKKRTSSRESNRRFNNRSNQDSDNYSRPRSDVRMTTVTCSSCGIRCEVPFKPKTSKPLFCDACFTQKDKSNSNRSSKRDFDIINEKLDKIMEALKIK